MALTLTTGLLAVALAAAAVTALGSALV
jgi:hypothetical protein